MTSVSDNNKRTRSADLTKGFFFGSIEDGDDEAEDIKFEFGYTTLYPTIDELFTAMRWHFAELADEPMRDEDHMNLIDITEELILTINQDHHDDPASVCNFLCADDVCEWNPRYKLIVSHTTSGIKRLKN
jgi:hypothetical protein